MQMVQLTPEIGQRLFVARLRPERTSDPLTLDWTAAGMQDEEGDELLLSRARWMRGKTAVSENTESSEELHAENGRNSHESRLLSIHFGEQSLTEKLLVNDTIHRFRIVIELVGS